MKGVKISRDKMGRHLTCMGEMEQACRILFIKHDGKRPLEDTYRCVDNIKMNLTEFRKVSQ
jgi:hypothetical protein